MCLLYKLTGKVFWFQSNFTLFFALQNVWQDFGWDCRGPAVPSSPNHSPEGLKGEVVNQGEGNAKGNPRVMKIQGISHLGQPAPLCPCQAVLESCSLCPECSGAILWARGPGNLAADTYSFGWKSLVNSFENCGSSLGSCPDSYMPLGLQLPHQYPL